MNTDNKRIFLAGALIFIVLLLQPFYYNWLGINPNEHYEKNEPISNQKNEPIKKELSQQRPIKTSTKIDKFIIDEEFIIINTSRNENLQ